MRGLNRSKLMCLRRWRLLNNVHGSLLRWTLVEAKARRRLLGSSLLELGILRWVNNTLRILLRVRVRESGRGVCLESDVCASISDGAILEIRRFEYDTLIVTFALAFTFNTIFADGSFLTAFDATSTTCQASSLCSFS